MKNIISRSKGAVIGLTLLILSGAALAESIEYRAVPGGKVVVAGTSTVHDWEVSSKFIGGSMVFSSSYPLDPSKGDLPALKASPEVKVIMPVFQLKSGKKKMDEVMHKAMNLSKHKTIKYEVTKMVLGTGSRKGGDPIIFDTEGKLTVSGVTKTVKFPVSVTKATKSRLKISGTTALKMSDFGIDAPAPKVALGLIRTGDDIKLTFDWLVGPPKAKK
jgi:hypothetical protein